MCNINTNNYYLILVYNTESLILHNLVNTAEF